MTENFETDQWRVQTTAYGALNLDNIGRFSLWL